jgi:hypothetical protein
MLSCSDGAPLSGGALKSLQSSGLLQGPPGADGSGHPPASAQLIRELQSSLVQLRAELDQAAAEHQQAVKEKVGEGGELVRVWDLRWWGGEASNLR